MPTEPTSDRPASQRTRLEFEVDGRAVQVPDRGDSLLGVLRDELGVRSPKDGCSPQGQCGCCTVLVDGQPRVACVTPARRIRGRSVTTLDGLDPERRQRWAHAFTACGGSQCGFCTPGIILRLEGLHAKGTAADDTDAVEQALLAHLCRCTGWRTVIEAWETAVSVGASGTPAAATGQEAAVRRATLEGHTTQQVGPEVALGAGGFADDTAPEDTLVAVPDGSGGWAVGESLQEARLTAGKVQGRRTTIDPEPPLALPVGDWDLTLRTTWVEPAYLETDASWCLPGEEPVTPLANGGAFGGKLTSPAPAAARELADQHGRPVRVLLSREDAVRLGPKRPPIAAGLRSDGTGLLRVVRTPGIAETIAAVAPDLEVEEVDAPGPPTSTALRAAGWAEALVLLAGAAHLTGSAGPAPTTGSGNGNGNAEITSPDGATARATVALGPDPQVEVTVSCGRVLDERTLRSYCIGAAHMALGWVTSEGLALDDEGTVHDLTIRSFGILRAVDTPPITVTLDPADDREPVNGSDAVFAAVAAATWIAQDLPPTWPTGVPVRG